MGIETVTRDCQFVVVQILEGIENAVIDTGAF